MTATVNLALEGLRPVRRDPAQPPVWARPAQVVLEGHRLADFAGAPRQGELMLCAGLPGSGKSTAACAFGALAARAGLPVLVADREVDPQTTAARVIAAAGRTHTVKPFAAATIDTLADEARRNHAQVILAGNAALWRLPGGDVTPTDATATLRALKTLAVQTQALVIAEAQIRRSIPGQDAAGSDGAHLHNLSDRTIRTHRRRTGPARTLTLKRSWPPGATAGLALRFSEDVVPLLDD